MSAVRRITELLMDVAESKPLEERAGIYRDLADIVPNPESAKLLRKQAFELEDVVRHCQRTQNELMLHFD